MTENERFQIIHLGNPYDFVVKDHATNKTYGTLQGNDKSLTELLEELAEENRQVKRENDILIKERLGEERLKQEIADYHTSNGRLHRLNNELIRRLDEFHIDYSDILREFE